MILRVFFFMDLLAICIFASVHSHLLPFFKNCLPFISKLKGFVIYSTEYWSLVMGLTFNFLND